ncbi:MAG: hypothetical protein DRN66_01335 [Candidatus Nanohalarchaeota archaeon]|nr:MAG: hypothetical protein DRN66_01335 [Candidatus Nanohaloarchaeota archaeon]
MHIDVLLAALIHLIIGYFASSLYFREKNRTLMKLTRIALIMLFALCAYGFIKYNYLLFGVILLILIMCEIMYFFNENKNTVIKTFSAELENVAVSTHHTIDRQIVSGMIFLLPFDILLYFYFQNRAYIDFAGNTMLKINYNPLSLMIIFFVIYLMPILIGKLYRNLSGNRKKEEELMQWVAKKTIAYAKNNRGVIDINEIAIECEIPLKTAKHIMKNLKKKKLVQYINRTWVIKKYLMEEE